MEDEKKEEVNDRERVLGKAAAGEEDEVEEVQEEGRRRGGGEEGGAVIVRRSSQSPTWMLCMSKVTSGTMGATSARRLRLEAR